MKSNVTIKDLKLFLKDILDIDLENLKPNESVTAKVGFITKLVISTIFIILIF